MPRHRCLRCHHCRHREPSFAPLLLLPLHKRARNGQQCCCTIVQAVAAFHCHAPLFTPLPLLQSCEKARNGQQCQGTIVHTAAAIIPLFAPLPSLPLSKRVRNSQCAKALPSAPPPFICTAGVIAIAQAGMGRPTMVPRHHLPFCPNIAVHLHRAATINTVTGASKERPPWHLRCCHHRQCAP
jgi:hypothetical protein